jgi:hypothetical protein
LIKKEYFGLTKKSEVGMKLTEFGDCVCLRSPEGKGFTNFDNVGGFEDGRQYGYRKITSSRGQVFYIITRPGLPAVHCLDGTFHAFFRKVEKSRLEDSLHFSPAAAHPYP